MFILTHCNVQTRKYCSKTTDIINTLKRIIENINKSVVGIYDSINFELLVSK